MDRSSADSSPVPTPSSGRLIEVSAGLVFDRGRLLIARRYPDAHCGGLWEFPGGKREEGETLEGALERELLEELGVHVQVGALIDAVEHAYPTRAVHVHFFQCRITAGRPRPLGCDEVAWVERAQLSNYDFPTADARLLDRLRGEDGFWTP